MKLNDYTLSKKYPFYRQYDRMDCGPTCIRMISKFYGKSFDGAYLRELTSLRGDGASMGGLVDAAENIGFGTLVLSSDYKTLAEQIPLPCIAHWRQRHYVVVYEATATKVVVADPGHGLITYSPTGFFERMDS